MKQMLHKHFSNFNTAVYKTNMFFTFMPNITSLDIMRK